MKKTNPFLVSLAIFFSLLVFASNANLSSAQSPLPTAPAPDTKDTSTSGKYAVLAPLPCIEGNGIECEGGNGALQKEVDFKTYVQYTINLLIALSAVTAVVMIVWGGIEYMFNNSFTSKKSGLERAQNAIYGLLLVLSSYIILRTIDPRLVEIPNTLVPQLVVEEWLTPDVTNILLDKLQNSVNNYKLDTIETIKEKAEIRQQMNQKEVEIQDILKQIKALGNVSPTDPELVRLKLELAKVDGVRKNLEGQMVSKDATLLMQGIVVEARQHISEQEGVIAKTLPQKFQFIDQEKDKINKIVSETNSDLDIINELQLKKSVTERGAYEKSILETDKAFLGVSSMKIEKIRDGISTTRLVFGTPYLYYYDENGLELQVNLYSSDKVKYLAEVNSAFERQLSGPEQVKNQLSDQSLKRELEATITKLREDFSKKMVEAKKSAGLPYKE
jgi:hypothetical protein